MLIQGSLQIIFDALYEMGVIDPVLNLDWNKEYKKIEKNPMILQNVVEIVNKSKGDLELLKYNLNKCDQDSLHYLAMEVAREFADFYSRTEIH